MQEEEYTNYINKNVIFASLQVNLASPYHAIANPSEIPWKFKICDKFGRGCPLVVTKWAAHI